MAARRASDPGPCPEVDCIRSWLPRSVIAAAERRAQSIGVGAERVLICADAITEEAYLTALAHSRGTSYEWLDGVSRADCPLDDNQLIKAAAVGLLPLRRDGGVIWIVAPRGLTARRLADPRQPRQQWLRGFRLTSSRHLAQFVARHTQRALGRAATDGLHRAQPLFSNAPRAHGWSGVVATAFFMVAAAIVVMMPAAAIKTVGTLLCTVFLAAAALRLSSAFYTRRAPKPAVLIDDDKLPVYTIICALYDEATVVEDLIAAIRAFDYPGIMAQTPQAA